LIDPYEKPTLYWLTTTLNAFSYNKSASARVATYMLDWAAVR